MKDSTVSGLILGIFTALVTVSAADNIVLKSSISCYSCTGVECSRPTLLNKTAVCSDPLDVCVTVFAEYAVVARGCYLDVPDTYRAKCEDQNNIECYRCLGSFCNNVAREDVQCLQCDSSSDQHCLQHPATLQSTRCPLGVSANSYCFVSYTANITIRGCSLDVHDQLSCYNSQNCMLCLPNLGQACNAVEFPSNRRKCITCDDGCVTSNAAATYCQKSDDQCVSMKMNGKVMKGCLETLDQSENKYCTDNPKMCAKCSSNACNLAEFNPNASNVNGASLIISLIFSILILFRCDYFASNL